MFTALNFESQNLGILPEQFASRRWRNVHFELIPSFHIINIVENNKKSLDFFKLSVFYRELWGKGCTKMLKNVHCQLAFGFLVA